MRKMQSPDVRSNLLYCPVKLFPNTFGDGLKEELTTAYESLIRDSLMLATYQKMQAAIEPNLEKCSAAHRKRLLKSVRTKHFALPVPVPNITRIPGWKPPRIFLFQ